MRSVNFPDKISESSKLMRYMKITKVNYVIGNEYQKTYRFANEMNGDMFLILTQVYNSVRSSEIMIQNGKQS
jgi:hypothetical protein